MKYIKDKDYESLWNQLEKHISDLASESDWLGAVAENPVEEAKQYSKRDMCNEILSLMEQLLSK